MLHDSPTSSAGEDGGSSGTVLERDKGKATNKGRNCHLDTQKEKEETEPREERTTPI